MQTVHTRARKKSCVFGAFGALAVAQNARSLKKGKILQLTAKNEEVLLQT